MKPYSTISRRSFVRRLALGIGTLAIGPAGNSLFTFNDARAADGLEEALRLKLQGTVVQDGLLVEEFATDFGKVLRREPRIIVKAAGDEDVLEVFRTAQQFGVPVHLRGAGHSCFGQSLADGGILLVNNVEDRQPELSDGTAIVHSSTQWQTLEATINREGYTSPVLTDFLGLTVGGTLSVGGYGLRSFQHGAQVDNVAELELLLVNGERLVCSNEQNSEMFRFALSGLGQLGYIGTVKMKPIAYHPFTSVFYILNRTIAEFTDNLRKLLAPDFIHEIDHFSAYWVSGAFIIEIGKSVATRDATELADIKDKVGSRVTAYKNTVIKDYHFYLHGVREQWVARYGVAHHLWEDYLLDQGELDEFLHRAIDTMQLNRYKEIIPACYIVCCDGSKSRGIPFSPTYGEDGNMRFGVGFYYMVKYGRREQVDTAKAQHQELMRNCLELNGRPYLYGWHNLSDDQKNALYGDDYRCLRELKKIHDPDNILNPGKFVAFS